MFSKLRTLICLAVAALCALGAVCARADYAILGNGFRLHVERQEDQATTIRLFIAGGGYVDVDRSELQGYEKEIPKPIAPASPSTGVPETGMKPADMPELLASAGHRQGLDPALLKSMIAEESNFNRRAVSRKGAAGLMQLMPDTGQLVGVKDLFNAVENVQGGALYIRTLLERYRGDLALALAAYNAGPAIVDRYRGIPPYTETQNYVRRVITRFNHEKTGK